MKIKAKNVVKYIAIVLDQDMPKVSTCKSIFEKVNHGLKFLYHTNNFLDFRTRKLLCSSLLQIGFNYAHIAAIRDHLTLSATEQLIYCLVTSRLDYCNSLLYGIPKYKINYLQRVQNIDARVAMRCP